MTATQIKSNGNYSVKEIDDLAVQLEKASPQTVLRWAIQRFGERVTLATGFGAEGCVLVHMLSDIDPNARLSYLDTDLLFPETYDLRDRLKNRYGVRFERHASALDLGEQALKYGEKLWETDPDKCCNLRKVQPLIRLLSGFNAWITAIRRDQSPTRANIRIVERDAKFGLIKINPLARWSSDDVWRFIRENDVQYNPLHDEGFPSIGCRPCTTFVRIGENPRAGRWRGSQKTECGLHK